MSKAKPFHPKCHRAVNFNEKAIAAVIAKHGYILAGIKVDGFRCHIFWLDGDLHITTREGNEILALVNFKQYFKDKWVNEWKLGPTMALDAEVWIPGVDFQTMSGHLRRHEPLAPELAPQFIVIDLMNVQQLQDLKSPTCADLGNNAFTIRNAAVVQRWPYVFGTNVGMRRPVVTEALARVESLEALYSLYKLVREQGFEGLVLKDPSCPLRNGKVAGQWKMKPGCGGPGWEGDGTVVGYVWGDDTKANAGLIVGFVLRLEDGTEVNATGLSKAHMEQYTRELQDWSFRTDNRPQPHFGRQAQAEAMEKTKGGSLRHPSFKDFRDLDYTPGVKI